MSRRIVRFIFSFAFLFAFAASARAQATGSDCSTADQPTKTWNQQPPDPLCTGSVDNISFTVYSTTVDTCTNNNTGSEYAQSVRQVTGVGLWHCSNFSSLSMKCNPNITQQVTHATSGSDYNRFYLRAWDADPSKYCGTVVAESREDFWQCQGVACNPPPPCSPVGSPPYGGNGVCYSWDTTSCSWVQSTCNNSPILVDVSGGGFQLTSAAGGVSYDISGSGSPIQIGWTAPGAQDAFLCLPDAYGNCNTGKQLFGNFTPQPASSTPNGFAALAVYDSPANGGNGDGIIDAHDAIFSSLRLWIDANHDGVSQPNELFTLPSLGITSISLNYKWDQRTDQYGNVFRYRARVGRTDGTTRMAYDVFFAGSSTTAKATPRASTTSKAAPKACPPRSALSEGKALLK